MSQQHYNPNFNFNQGNDPNFNEDDFPAIGGDQQYYQQQ